MYVVKFVSLYFGCLIFFVVEFLFILFSAGLANANRQLDDQVCLNKVILMGRCVSTPTVKAVDKGIISSFIMATNKLRRSTVTNQVRRHSDFHRVSFYNQHYAKKVFDNVTKG